MRPLGLEFLRWCVSGQLEPDLKLFASALDGWKKRLHAYGLPNATGTTQRLDAVAKMSMVYAANAFLSHAREQLPTAGPAQIEVLCEKARAAIAIVLKIDDQMRRDIEPTSEYFRARSATLERIRLYESASEGPEKRRLFKEMWLIERERLASVGAHDTRRPFDLLVAEEAEVSTFSATNGD